MKLHKVGEQLRQTACEQVGIDVVAKPGGASLVDYDSFVRSALVVILKWIRCSGGHLLSHW